MTDKEYRQAEGLAQSTLKLLRDKTPAHALHAMQNKKEPSEAMLIGSAVHAIVLENRIGHVVLPDAAKGSSKLAKALRADFEAEHSDKIVLSQASADKVMLMAESVLSHKGASALLSIDGQSELPIFWEETIIMPDGERVVKMKGKLDRSNPLGVIDLKKTCESSMRRLSIAIESYGYHIQAAHYLAGAAANGLPADDFIFIFVEDEAPHLTHLKKLDHESIFEGELARQELIKKYLKCVDNNYWPGYNDSIETISIPRYGFRHSIYEEN